MPDPDGFDWRWPQPGYFATRLVRGGIEVAARIWVVDGDRCPETGELMSDQEVFAELDGERTDPWRLWERTRGATIDEGRYRYLVAKRDAARRGDPELTPRERPDFEKIDADRFGP